MSLDTTTHKKGGVWWICKCICGSYRSATSSMLVRSTVKSCGCMNFTSPHGNSKYLDNPSEATINSRINTYKQSARRRGLLWELSNIEAKNLMLANCLYCGSPPRTMKNVYSTKSGIHRSVNTNHVNGAYINLNGIDRVDNVLGYTIANSVSCCWYCNRAKHNLSLNEFKAWIDDIVNFTKGTK